jgi:hypothetical protein
MVGDELQGRAAAARTSRCSSSKTVFTMPVASPLHIPPPANDVSWRARQLEVRAARPRRQNRGTSTPR